jgi:DNA-binding NarL/FixJ family response regulator
MSLIRTVVVDDHGLIREGTRQILEREPDFEVVGEASTGAEALELIARLEPDLALLDLRLPDISGIEIARQLRDQASATRVVLLSAFDDEEYVVEALSAGAAGYLVKTMPSHDLVRWLRHAHRGEVALDPQLASRLARYVGRTSVRSDEPVFSTRELGVLRLLATGLPNKQIARQLGISPRTVEGHLSRIFGKLGISSRTEAVLYAVNHRLVDVDQVGVDPEVARRAT